MFARPSTVKMMKEKVALIGSGNWYRCSDVSVDDRGQSEWPQQSRSSFIPARLGCIEMCNRGSVIAKICGRNTSVYPEFADEVRMWVFEEMIEGQRLSEIINTRHENVKYLPNVPLPRNIVAYPDLHKAVEDATLLVFVIPHQFVKGVCRELQGNIRPDARAISLIKGVDVASSGLHLISDMIRENLSIDVSVLMGANIASEVAKEQFCEATVGSRRISDGQIWKKLFATSYFHLSVVDDVAGVELCGALKNVVAIAAGLVDGLKFGENTKAAIIRIGLMEMKKFAKMFYHGVKDETFFESCGVADVITTCFGGRNRLVAEARVTSGKSFAALEQEMLNGQKLQGTLTSYEVHQILKIKNLVQEFPLFTAVYRICYEDAPPKSIVEMYL
ncbi:NAD-dependent glycerol-3-phosphate dehydrogenase C-terminus-domain-containing protein [Polychytrium aggregatum]|uniref:NAD-dependent glycerol-3-phosphate dehydrogenase C-terminus-domain-containing protein n=1 Tax=Polychytrium aggregatum TaxID=110093 RepID=UPI0022FDDBEB|nr:NAD-dependent glycerol-3-phosphate dehydrogenase C-terminus-domain-containing protein [Polychytrium aggregatum]KAI9197399.1 NAD-dependent glycerol-3-phosphate dehydrogenase C-terminus-domain-containing protein [Polychytrium aggregatum]